MKYIGLFLFISCFGCHQPVNNHQIVNDTNVTVPAQDSIPKIAKNDPAKTDTIPASYFADQLPKERLQKIISKADQEIQITIRNAKPGSQLYIKVEHNRPDANIRIAQVVMPNGDTDGPFSRELLYDVKVAGDYIFIIRKSNMAEGSPVGTIYITLAKK